MSADEIMMITREQFENGYYEKVVRLDIVGSVLVMTERQVKELEGGKVLAYNDGEYVHFVVHEKYMRR